MTTDPDLVLVVGAGTMGAGIAQNMLDVGAEVVLVDANPAVGEAALARIRDGLVRQWRDEGGRDVGAAMSRLHVMDEIPDGCRADLVIEAVPESTELKRSVLGAVDAACPDATVIASNTSSLSIASLAGALRAPRRFVGMHFFNPVPRSALIEIIRADATGESTVEVARRWVERLRKTAIVVHDSPGFATSRLGLALGLEAIRMVEQGVASPEDIDLGMTLGYKHPIGPLRLTDLVGLDVRLGIAEHLASTLGPRFEPPALLRAMVADGRLGQKTRQGFYTWP